MKTAFILAVLVLTGYFVMILAYKDFYFKFLEVLQ